MIRNIIILLVFSLAACAKVSVHPLAVDGAALPNAIEGVRYYEPHPYLLVAQLPVVAATLQPNKEADITGQTGGTGKPNSDAEVSTATPQSTSDTSFLASNQQYTMKLVYLPDYSKPYAISESPGLFGTTEMKPQLQDGWMLVSLDATGDSKVSETLAAAASLASALGGTAPKAAAGAKALALVPSGATSPTGVLPPGLYRFDYDSGGHLTGLILVRSF